MVSGWVRLKRGWRAAELLPQGALLGLAFSSLFIAGCSPEPSSAFQGYLEGEYVYVSSPLSGVITSRPVDRGATIKKGDLVFVLEQDAELAGLKEAEDRCAQASSKLDNLRKGKRPSEVASVQARLEQARANLALSELTLERRKQLKQDGVISQEEWDVALRQKDSNAALVSSLESDLETSRLGAREDEIKAAEAELQAAQALRTKAKWVVDQKTQRAPVDGYIQETMYRPGEWVAAGSPVLSLLPPTSLKVRFFVPEPRLNSVTVGASVQIALDGRKETVEAKVNYISPQAEFTPPVIYSRETRSKLVFMVEAALAPEWAGKLNPGQPADVRLKAGQPVDKP